MTPQPCGVPQIGLGPADFDGRALRGRLLPRRRRPHNAVVDSFLISTAAFCGRQLPPGPNDHLAWSLGFTSTSTAAQCGRRVVFDFDGRAMRPSPLSCAQRPHCGHWASSRHRRPQQVVHRCLVQRWRPFHPRGPRSAVPEVVHRSTAALCSGGGLFALEDRRTRSSRSSIAPPLRKAAVAAFLPSRTTFCGPRGAPPLHRCPVQRWRSFCPRGPQNAVLEVLHRYAAALCSGGGLSTSTAAFCGRPFNAVVTSCSTTTAAFCGRLLLPEPNDHLVWSLGFGSASTTAPRGRHVVPHFDGRSTRPSLLEPNGHLVWPLGSRSTSTTALCGRHVVRPPRRPLNAAIGSFLSPTTTRCGRWAHPRPRRPRNAVVGSSLTSTAALCGRRFFLAPNGHLAWPLGSPSIPTAAKRGRRLLREPNGHLAWLLGSPLMATTASCGRRVIVELDGRLARPLGFPSSPSTAQRACRVVLDLGHHFVWWPGSYL
ncbi:hypothetical protein FISHEDRAFT_74092 [Fistulina hepatica ATCC 64428]|uniref:Uncharacterized protein n=1 Tax=Fistulina hepatica ATCC 64428 TaxID=1128425 RepID=A0A0D7ADN2_9AGAR|nr:hypothetical protein FISHEDRAFT_74092 [Fistulina hepatica ATCC 64428]